LAAAAGPDSGMDKGSALCQTENRPKTAIPAILTVAI
jgi:hypothetical protein